MLGIPNPEKPAIVALWSSVPTKTYQISGVVFQPYSFTWTFYARTAGFFSLDLDQTCKTVQAIVSIAVRFCWITVVGATTNLGELEELLRDLGSSLSWSSFFFLSCKALTIDNFNKRSSFFMRVVQAVWDKGTSRSISAKATF